MSLVRGDATTSSTPAYSVSATGTARRFCGGAGGSAAVSKQTETQPGIELGSSCAPAVLAEGGSALVHTAAAVASASAVVFSGMSCLSIVAAKPPPGDQQVRGLHRPAGEPTEPDATRRRPPSPGTTLVAVFLERAVTAPATASRRRALISPFAGGGAWWPRHAPRTGVARACDRRQAGRLLPAQRGASLSGCSARAYEDKAGAGRSFCVLMPRWKGDLASHTCKMSKGTFRC